jgi:hypothetical protein
MCSDISEKRPTSIFKVTKFGYGEYLSDRKEEMCWLHNTVTRILSDGLQERKGQKSHLRWYNILVTFTNSWNIS